MSTNLAVFTAQLGTVSETFIRRHVEDLMPGRTVAVVLRASHPMGGRWTASCPVLFLDHWASSSPVRLARRAGFDEAVMRNAAVTRFLRRHKVDIVLGEYLDTFVEFVPLLGQLDIPYVVQGHGIDLSAALRQPGMDDRYRAYAGARAVLTRCEFHRRRLIDLGLDASHAHVNPGGVDIPLRLPLRAATGQKRFLAVGRMISKKGPIYLLEAFRRAAERDAELSLDYVGGGELLPAARQFVSAMGLERRVRLRAAAPEAVKLKLLEECGVFVQHSLTDPDTGDEEGLPAAIQEAMAYGMVVVGTRHSGIAEAVEDGVTGILCAEGDVDGMAEAMLRAARSDAAHMGVAAAEKAAREYSWPAEKARLLSHLGPRASGKLMQSA